MKVIYILTTDTNAHLEDRIIATADTVELAKEVAERADRNLETEVTGGSKWVVDFLPATGEVGTTIRKRRLGGYWKIVTHEVRSLT